MNRYVYLRHAATMMYVSPTIELTRIASIIPGILAVTPFL
jgi:hypothetical protein